MMSTYSSNRAVLAASLTASALLAIASPAGAQDSQVRWDMQSWFPSALPQAGTLGKQIEAKIDELSGGQFQIRFYEPGALMPPQECFDAVSAGAIEACWTISAYWHGRNPAFSVFSAVPFGPEWPELLGWYFEGGGKEMHEALYEPHNIKVLSCGGMSPEGAGWFRNEINSIEDFEGLKMRILGLGGAVLDEIGASTQLLPAGDLYPALELGTLDATEFATPTADRQLGFYEIANYYYGPGWHQPATLYQLIVNLDEWNALSDAQRRQLEIVCGDNIRQAIAEGEGLQAEPLAYFEEQGIEIRRFSDEILDELHEAWLRVAERYSEESPEFAEALESMKDYRREYQSRWKEWQRLPYRPAE